MINSLHKGLNIAMPEEWLDVLKVDGGNGKHPKGSWLLPDGPTMSHKDTHSAMFRHLSESYCHNRIDAGTQLDHLLSIAFRALAEYTRLQRGIKHLDDMLLGTKISGGINESN